MKKLASAVGAVILLLTAVPAGATSTEPGAEGHINQMAFSSWVVRDDGQTWLYLGMGINTMPSTGPSIGFVGRLPCKKVTIRGRSGIRCRGGMRGRNLLPGEFVIDPALNAATLSMDAKGKTHTVQWEGRGDQPEPYVHQHAGLDIGVLVMTMMWRRANTTAHLFGRDLAGKRGMMFEETYATAWTGTLRTPDGTRLAVDDGVLRVSKTFF